MSELSYPKVLPVTISFLFLDALDGTVAFPDEDDHLSTLAKVFMSAEREAFGRQMHFGEDPKHGWEPTWLLWNKKDQHLTVCHKPTEGRSPGLDININTDKDTATWATEMYEYLRTHQTAIADVITQKYDGTFDGTDKELDLIIPLSDFKPGSDTQRNTSNASNASLAAIQVDYPPDLRPRPWTSPPNSNTSNARLASSQDGALRGLGERQRTPYYHSSARSRN